MLNLSMHIMVNPNGVFATVLSAPREDGTMIHYVEIGEHGRALSFTVFCKSRQQAEAVAAAMTMHQVVAEAEAA